MMAMLGGGPAAESPVKVGAGLGGGATPAAALDAHGTGSARRGRSDGQKEAQV